jgi:hypothetical protein
MSGSFLPDEHGRAILQRAQASHHDFGKCMGNSEVAGGHTYRYSAGMAANARPYQVAVIGWLMILAGVISSTVHLWQGRWDRWMILIVLVGAVAVAAGVFLLRGDRWARWAVLAWIAFHVIIGTLNSRSFALPHLALLIIFSYVLLGPPTADYYRRPGHAQPSE